MIFPFKCYDCEVGEEVDSRPFTPPSAPRCPTCGESMSRVYGCQIDTSGCRDPDDVAPEHRVAVSQERNLSSGQAARIERAHQREIEKSRRELVDGNKGSHRLTHKVPAALHAAKIKETGDREYWNDPKNLNRHKSCKVD